MKNKEQVLNDLQNLFPDKEVIIQRNGNQIVFTQECINATYLGKFDDSLVDKYAEIFKHIVTVNDDNTYEAHDVLIKSNTQEEVGSFSLQGPFFLASIDSTTGEKTFIQRQWTTDEIKFPISQYMSTMGYSRVKSNSDSKISKTVIISVIVIIIVIILIVLYLLP